MAHYKHITAFFLLCMSLSFNAILAATCTFNGNGDGTSWSDANNWSCGSVPDPASDHVIIPSGFNVINDGGLDLVFDYNSDLTISGSLDMQGKKIEMAHANCTLTVASSGTLVDVKELFFVSNSDGLMASGANVTIEHIKVDDNSELIINSSCVNVTDKLENLSNAGIIGTGCINYTGSSGNFANTGKDGIFGCYSNTLSDCTLNGGGALPVELVSFTGELEEGNEVRISWHTASEKNNDYFILERSSNGMIFDELGRIPGNGTTQESNNYEFMDEFPGTGTYYYRLIQVDYDGQSETFKLIAVNIYDNGDLRCVLEVIPNPCVPNCTAELSDCSDATIETYIMDANGTMVRQLIPINQQTSGYSYQINKENYLMPGIYIINSRSSRVNTSKKIIVK